MDVLSTEELDFFAEEGYVVARQVIDRDQAERTGQAVWAFTGMDPDDPGTWYPEDRRGIMVEIYHHQTMWDNRTAPRVHRAFSQIWGTDQAVGQPRPSQHQSTGLRQRCARAQFALGRYLG